MKSHSFKALIVLALLLSMLGGAVTVTPAYAAGIVVNTNADNTTSADGFCTLREAIINANSDSDTTGGDCTAGSGADTITFAANYTITLAGSQLPVITSQITITGNGAANTIIQASTCDPITLPLGCTPATYRVFMINGNVTLNDLTIQHGDSSSSVTPLGGGIYSLGDLVIQRSIVKNNKSGAGGGIYALGTVTISIDDTVFESNTAQNGGGIYADNGSLTLTNVTFSNNSATDGGGMYNFNGSFSLTNVIFNDNTASLYGGGIANWGMVTIANSTFLNNRGTDGGAIYIEGSFPNTIENSTLSANTATSRGGAIFTDDKNADLTLTNSTLSGNGAGTTGGGIHIGGVATNFFNTIIANSTSGGDCFLDNIAMYGEIGSNINSLVEDGSCSTNGVDFRTGDPNLGPLANNGGTTQTHALLTGSPAIDTGDAGACPSTDQRGVSRPQGARCDIGAYEVEGGIPVVIASNPSAGATLASLSSITVVFNQDMLDDASADGAENVNNYLLVERGANGVFDTLSCAGGVVSDDVQQTISTASYNSAGFITTLTLASPLANGTYRLFVCGTTSVWSIAGLELNNGASDYTVNFTIGTGTPSADTEATTASALPKTGFAPNRITTLPPQPANAEYAALGDLVLEIPSLNVRSTIVGVPQNADDTWDVTWLNNDTGWLNGTAFPTWKGNSVLTAHVTNASGLDGPFAMLKSLQYGDQVIVHIAGSKYIYEVRNTRLVLPYAVNFTFESLPDHSYLTLITCQGYNLLNDSYLFRRVVRAVLVEVK